MPIAINTPAGAPPRKLFMDVLSQVFDQAIDCARDGKRPPQLLPAIERARAAQQRNDAGDLERHLRDVAHAAIATIVRVRAAEEDPDT